MKYFKLTELEVKYVTSLLYLEHNKERDIHKKSFIKTIIRELENLEVDKSESPKKEGQTTDDLIKKELDKDYE